MYLFALMFMLAQVPALPQPALWPTETLQTTRADPVGGPRTPDHIIVIQTPVGRQYMTLGIEAGVWLGSGTITSLTPEGELGDVVGDFSDQAYSFGPVSVGLMHVITRRLFLEARFGAGAVWFPNDRLINSDLDGDGESHVGLLLSAEVRGRTVTKSGLTAAFGLELGRVGLPEGSGAYLGANPSVGYLEWEEGYTGFWLVEVGYTYPVINGLAPEIPGSGLNEPIESQWHMLAVTTQFGF